MRSSTLFAAAGLAVATDAILLPSGTYSEDTVATNALPFEIALNSESRAVKVDCPGCPIMLNGQSGHFRSRPGDGSHLELDFAIDHAAAGDRLLLNGFELYPESDPLGPLPLRAAVKLDAEEAEARALDIGQQNLGFSLRVNPAVATDEDAKMQLVAVDLQVIEIGNVFIQGLSSVHVKLVRQPDTGALMIAKVDQAESENPAGPPRQCQSIMCALRGGMDSLFSQMRPHRQCNHPQHHHQMGSFASMMGHGSKPDHHAQQETNKVNAGEGQIHHHPQRTWASLYKQFSYTILLPILIGIVAGISVSLLGMVIGTFIVGTWRFFVRGQSFFPSRRCPRRCSATAPRKAAEQDAAHAEEKAGLMAAEEDALPIYTDEEDRKDQA